jgi:ADP-heptose:LPS heptosyltransferase
LTRLGPRKELSGQSIGKLLIVEPFDIGDAASISVMLHPLRERFPNAEIHLLLKPVCAELFEGCDLVHAVHTAELPWTRRRNKMIPDRKGWFSLLRTIRKFREIGFDLAIDARGEIRNQLLMLAVGAPIRVGYTNYLCSNIEIRGSLLTHSMGELTPKPRALLNLELLKPLGIDVSEPAYPSPFAPFEPRPRTSDTYRIVIHPGAAWEYKQWDPNNWVLLIKRLAKLPVEIHLVGSPSEKDLLQGISAPFRGIYATVTPTLLDLMSIIAGADLFVGNDSGPMHLAEYLDKPIIALFGPALINVWRPYGARHSVIHHQPEYPCAPCLQRQCIYRKFNCMDSIGIDEVYRAIASHVERFATAPPPQ